MTTSRPICVIGSLNMDLVVRCPRLPEPGETIFGEDFFTAAGGKGANQAVAAARLGATVTMAGCVGDDAFGRDLLAGLRRDGVNADRVRMAREPTGTALITVDAQGGNTIVVVSGANATCDTALVDSVIAGPPGILLLQHEIPEAVNARALRTAHSAGWLTVLNPAPARPIDAELLPLIDIIVPNETEAASLTGIGNPLEAARCLLTQGARAVLVTLGSAGALYCSGGVTLHCPAVAVPAVDTTAAGDAYIGALAAVLAESRSMTDSLAFAATAASLAVTRLGAQPSLGSRAEVAAFVAQYGEPVVEQR